MHRNRFLIASIICFALALLCALGLSGAIYYVDTAAAAGGDGTTQALTGANCAWDTIADVNAATFNPGDSVLFKRGCTWREQLTVPSSGSSGNVITLGAYGTGADPIISGANLITTWTETTSADAEKTEYQEDGTNTVSNITGWSGAIYSGNGFMTANTSTVSSIQLSLKKVLSPVGNLKVEIYGSSAGAPSAVIANGTSGTVAASGLGTSFAWVEFTFATPPTITGGTNYFWFISTSSAQDMVNYVAMDGGYSATGAYYRDNSTAYCRWNGTNVPVWTTSNVLVDDKFRLYLSAPLSNVWQATDTTEPNIVIFNGTRGTEVASKALCNSANKWYWAANVLYVYSTSDPDTAYISPGIEAGTRDTAVEMGAKSYVALENIDVQGGNIYGGIFVYTNSVASSNITIQGCTIRNNYSYGINVTNGHATYKTTDVLIDSNTVYENGLTGICVGNGVNTITISNNIVHHNNWTRQDYNAGIRTNSTSGVDCQGVVIEYNTVYNQYFSGATWAQGNGIHVDHNSGAVPAIVRYNKVYDNERVGIFIERTPNAKVYYNLCYGNAETGILVFRYDGGVNIDNNVVYDNLIGIALRGEDASDRGMIGHVVKNNISVGNTDHQLVATYGAENDGVMGSANVYLNNCFGPEGTNFIEWGSGVHKSTYDAWETAYGGTTSSVEADPAFVSTVTPDFHLQSASPCINAGVDVGLTEDYAGKRVPRGNRVDIGAYEFQPKRGWLLLLFGMK